MGDRTRRAVLLRGAGLVAGTLAIPLLGATGWAAPVAEAAAASNQQTNATRAVTVYNAMQKYFYVQGGTSLYRETYPWTGGNKYSYLWPFSRALVGTLALAGVSTSYTSAVQNRFTGLANYWDGRASPPGYDSYVLSQGGGDKYYDDNAWVSLAFIEAYRTRLTTLLDRATQLFTFAKPGADTIAQNPDSGRIFCVQ